MLNTPFSPWPSFTEDEADAVRRVLLSNKVNYWTGTECREFEREFAAWCGTEYAVAMANGTVALEAALRAIGIGPGDEVVVTPRTFIASVSCVVSVGGTPVFADVERDSGNISASTVEKVISPRTKAIICVHLAGWPCEMDPILALAERHGLKIIEDCAQAHGARYKGRSVGSMGHVGAWSFCQDKIISTGGEGGMVTTNDKSLWRRMWSFKDHGKSFEATHDRNHPPGFRWVHETIGTNARMTEMQAAIGRIQLRKLSEWRARRNNNAEHIWNACRSYPAIRVPQFNLRGDDTVHAHYKCYVYLKQDEVADGWTRERIIREISDQGVPCYEGICSEVYLEKAFVRPGIPRPASIKTAQELGETSLMFLVHPTLTKAEIALTCTVTGKVLLEATRHAGVTTISGTKIAKIDYF